MQPLPIINGSSTSTVSKRDFHPSTNKAHRHIHRWKQGRLGKFSIQYPLEWVNIHAAGSFDSEIANDYNLFATPSMFLIDENHKIIAKPTTIGELEKNIGERNKMRTGSTKACADRSAVWQAWLANSFSTLIIEPSVPINKWDPWFECPRRHYANQKQQKQNRRQN